MKKVENIKFNREEVLVNDLRYGKLEFDEESQEWVLWTGVTYTDDDLAKLLFGSLNSDEGTNYYNDLEETQAEITAELEEYNN